MPIFEFSCNTCNTGRRFSALVGVVARATPPACPKCGGVDLRKAVSRFARLRSEDESIDSLADKADSIDMNDPKAMRHLMHEMAGEMGDDIDGGDFEQMLDEAIDEEAGATGVSATEDY